VSTARAPETAEHPALDAAELARRIAAAGSRRPARDEEAELCRRYGRRLVAFGRRQLGSADAGRDLAQDALLLTIEKLRSRRVREPERIGAFVLGVARTLASGRRAREARLEPIEAADLEPVAASVAPPDPIARSRVTGCLEALPEKQRAVILLTFYAEQSSGDIAGSLGLSAENVRVIRHRSVARLRDCLGLAGVVA
jgi:RNA polymerase sigma-70 factor (ECF subfamily)